MLNGKTILITGGTGSFGQMFIRETLKKYKPKKIIVYSRDEMKQWKMQNEFKNHDVLRFFIGDVRDKDRLKRAMVDVDIVIHAAATKIVHIAEYNPFECIKTNINGAMNVIDSCLDTGVKTCIALSTDKACNPINLYGATKLASDKLFVAANAYSGLNGTKFGVVRYGNVMGSRGSVIPFFLQCPKDEPLPITDVRMTRFMISLDEAVSLVWTVIDDLVGGEIYVKKIPSMNIVEIAKTIRTNLNYSEVGIRPGEKLHEMMISSEDAQYTYEYASYYKIIGNLNNWSSDPNRIKDGKKVDADFVYSSNKNQDWMTISQLSNWISKNLESFLD